MAEVFIHFPLPYYSADQLIRSLHAHQAFHKRQGTYIPDPRAYQKMVVECLKGSPSKANVDFCRDTFSQLMQRNHKRLVLSFPGLPNSPYEVFGKKYLLPNLHATLRQIRSIFPNDSLTLLFGLVNQGKLLKTLIEANVAVFYTPDSVASALKLTWSRSISAGTASFDDIKIIFWNHDQAAYIWPALIKVTSGFPGNQPAPGSLDMLVQQLSEEGITRLKQAVMVENYIAPKSLLRLIDFFVKERSFQRMLIKDIDRYWWTDDLRGSFNHIFEKDLLSLESYPNFSFISPDHVSLPVVEQDYV